jgi:outer membrane protein OmpA-like peptidoglycan-associated protein
MRRHRRDARTGLRVAFVLGALGLSTAAAAGDRDASFVTCPVARDAGPDADVCFLADYQGTSIALENPTDWGAPELQHRVLVEGIIKEEAGTCGALKFEGRASVLPELAPECSVILPYDGSFKGVAGGVFNRGSPAQKAYAQALADRIATDPAASIEPAILDPPVPSPPAPPFLRRQLVIMYPFESTRGSGPDMAKLHQLADYAQLSKASRVEIAGYRAVSKLSDGTSMTERQELARLRAQLVAAVMTRLGVDARILSTRWESDAIAGTGHEDWRNRKVEITVTPRRER